MSEPVPSWFRGQLPRQPGDDLTEPCPKCGAPPGERCRYTTSAGSHRDPATGGYVDNVPGQPMIRTHHARPKKKR